MTTREPFDLEKEAEILLGIKDFPFWKTHCGDQRLVGRIVAFGRRCADEALERAARLMDKKVQDYYGWKSTDESVEGAKIRDLKSSAGTGKL